MWRLAYVEKYQFPPSDPDEYQTSLMFSQEEGEANVTVTVTLDHQGITVRCVNGHHSPVSAETMDWRPLPLETFPEVFRVISELLLAQ